MKKYFFLQVKRMKVCIPYLLCYLLLIVAGMGCLFLLLQKKNADETKKIPIGIAGNLSEDYFNIGFVALTKFDSSNHTVELFRMSEEEAKEALYQGRITAYAVIPDGFVESVFHGENKQIEFVTASASYDLGNQIVEELTEVISRILTETQNAIYGMQQLAEEKGIDYDQSEAVEELNLRYIKLVLERPDLFELQYLSEIPEAAQEGMRGSVLTEGEEALRHYYSCAFFVSILSFWGMGCVLFATRRDIALARLFRARGYAPFYLVFGEYLAYTLWLFCGACAVLGIGTVFGMITGAGSLSVPVGRWIPVVFTLAAVQFLLYECTNHVISAVLLQFITALAGCYMSGCFYPVTFFPKAVQVCAGFLPQGISLQYLLEQKNGGLLPILLLYIVLCVGTAVFLRTYKMEGSAR